MLGTVHIYTHAESERDKRVLRSAVMPDCGEHKVDGEQQILAVKHN